MDSPDSPDSAASAASAGNCGTNNAGSGDHGGPIVKAAVAPPGPWA